GHGQHPLVGCQRAEADLDGKHAAVAAACFQINELAHGPHCGTLEPVLPMRAVLSGQVIGDEHLQPLDGAFAALVAEQGLGLVIGQPDAAGSIHPHQSVRNGVQNLLQVAVGQAGDTFDGAGCPGTRRRAWMRLESQWCPLFTTTLRTLNVSRAEATGPHSATTRSRPSALAWYRRLSAERSSVSRSMPSLPSVAIPALTVCGPTSCWSLQ